MRPKLFAKACPAQVEHYPEYLSKRFVEYNFFQFLMSSKVTPMFDATAIAGITLETTIEPQSKKGTNQIRAFFYLLVSYHRSLRICLASSDVVV